MLNKEQILEIAEQKQRVRTSDISKDFNVSRQYVNKLIAGLVRANKLIKIGSTNKAFYATPEFAREHLEILPTSTEKTFRNKSLEEHRVLDQLERDFPLILKLQENVRSIFTFAFSEMLNNAIEHSQSEKVKINLSIKNDELVFAINDSGIGVFRNIMKTRKLKSELEAIQDLLKGKTTTMPKSHSGEGIFFTSKVGDEFILDSFGWRLIVNNKIKDLFLQKPSKLKRGTKVVFKLSTKSDRHLNDVFKQYTNIGDDSDYGFDKTDIKIKLYTLRGVHVSRSQARRVLAGLEKFILIVFDFEKVSMVGQAFADEIFRVFKNKYPKIKIEAVNMNEAVEFMVNRVEGNKPNNPTLSE